jgi:hypothetical protein
MKTVADASGGGRTLRLMSGDDARQALADQLLALPAPELVDVLRRVLLTRTSTRNGQTTCTVLAEVMRQTDGLGDPQDLFVAAVAWPDRDFYDGGFGPEPELWEEGTCWGCGIEVTSTAKRAACPVCGTACELT